MTDARKAAEANRMNESSKRRLMIGLQGKKKNQQAEAVLVPLTGVDLENQTLTDRLRQLNAKPVPRGAAKAVPSSRRGETAKDSASRAAGKRRITVHLNTEPASKSGRQTEVPRAILIVEDDDSPTDPITIACSSKTVQFANHMILGSQI
ncbi:unnamed protein product [Prunus armeniaca]